MSRRLHRVSLGECGISLQRGDDWKSRFSEEEVNLVGKDFEWLEMPAFYSPLIQLGKLYGYDVRRFMIRKAQLQIARESSGVELAVSIRCTS